MGKVEIIGVKAIFISEEDIDLKKEADINLGEGWNKVYPCKVDDENHQITGVFMSPSTGENSWYKLLTEAQGELIGIDENGNRVL